MSGNGKYGEAVNYNIYLEPHVLDPLGFIAFIIFKVDNYDFLVGKPIPTCTYFFWGRFIFLS